MSPHKCVAFNFSQRGSFEPFSGPYPYLINDRHVEFVEPHAEFGIMVDRSLKFHAQIRKVVAHIDSLKTNILCSTLCRDGSFLMSIFTSYDSSLWSVR